MIFIVNTFFLIMMIIKKCKI